MICIGAVTAIVLHKDEEVTVGASALSALSPSAHIDLLLSHTDTRAADPAPR